MPYSDQVQIMHDAFQRYVQSRPPRIKIGRQSVVDNRHRETKVTWMPAGAGLCWWILYCPECKHGTVTDMVREHPDGPNARELGIINKKEWSLDCPVVTKENAERGEQSKLDLPH